MGIPSFYRWLVQKYPKTVVKAIVETTEDSTLPNPNGLEFDNFYLDMNGIIYPCFLGNDQPSPPNTTQEIFNNIYEFTDRLFHVVRPRKLLYMAIDGVSPRAKMNHQRSGRFMTAKAVEFSEAELSRLENKFKMEGKPVFQIIEPETLDTNLVNPGTEFMQELSKALKSYIDLRLKTDAAWKDIKVILSDANVPGEGEHKIVSFIRHQRNFPNYDPNTSHCLYGHDADLIMLALATHEIHFSILREVSLTQEQQVVCESSGETSVGKEEAAEPSLLENPYEFLHIWILREYLELDLKILDTPNDTEFDLERIVDDFIFMCFFVGNDFLPHLPTLKVHEGAIDLLMHVYKKDFKNLGGYLVDMQWLGDEKETFVNLKRVERFILLVGAKEEYIFKKRSKIRDRILRRLHSEYSDAQEEEKDPGPGPDFEHNSSADDSEILKNTKEMIEKLCNSIHDRSDMFKNGSFMVDKVKLGEPGFRERYYKEKFSAETKEDIERTRKDIVQKYTEGLCWVLSYYFAGVPSWSWFYPYHYGPFASDLNGISQAKVNFQKGSPFKPFDQLMGVVPPRSAHVLPKAYQALMTKEDSEIIDFYPTDFEVDMDGKRFMGQTICKLPFINEERLLSETKKLEVELEDGEAARNNTHADLLFVRSSNKLSSQFFSLGEKELSEKQITEIVKEPIDVNLGACNMDVSAINFVGPSTSKDSEECQDDNVLCVHFELPDGCQHHPRPLEGVHFPDKMICEGDIVERQLWHHWHEYQGKRPNYSFNNQGLQRERNFEVKSRLTESSYRVIHKGAGTGWGGCRGRGQKNSSDSSQPHSEGSENFPVGFGEAQILAFSSKSPVGEAGRGRGGYINNSSDGHDEKSTSIFSFGCSEGCTFSSGQKSDPISRKQDGAHVFRSSHDDHRNSMPFSGNTDKWKAMHSGQVESMGIEDTRVSDSFGCGELVAFSSRLISSPSSGKQDGGHLFKSSGDDHLNLRPFSGNTGKWKEMHSGQAECKGIEDTRISDSFGCGEQRAFSGGQISIPSSGKQDRGHLFKSARDDHLNLRLFSGKADKCKGMLSGRVKYKGIEDLRMSDSFGHSEEYAFSGGQIMSPSSGEQQDEGNLFSSARDDHLKLRPFSGNTSKGKGGHPGQVKSKGIEISDSRQGSKSHGRNDRTTKNNFWPSRNSSMPDRDGEWR